jgi:hypothetical protein
MANEKEATVDFLNEISGAKPDIFKEEPAEEVIEEVEEEKPLDFHKDPRVQRFIDKKIAAALKDVRDVRASAEQQFKQEVKEINLPSSFIKLVGNDTPEKVEVLKDLDKYFGNLKGEARNEFLQEMQEREQQSKAQDAAALDELQSGFETIEEDYGVDLDTDRATRTKFVEFLRKVSPKNEDGEVKEFADIPSAWETFQDLNKRTSQPTRAKELASRGLTRSNEVSEIPKGPQASKGDPWRQFDQFLDKIKRN